MGGVEEQRTEPAQTKVGKVPIGAELGLRRKAREHHWELAAGERQQEAEVVGRQREVEVVGQLWEVAAGEHRREHGPGEQ